MRSIAIINQKGGCGKTTVAINLAATLAGQGRRTLLVDMDPQSHCALGLAVPDSQLDRSVADLLRHGLDGTIPFEDVVWQITRHLDLAPSTIGLAGVEADLVGQPDRDRRLLQLLSTVANRYEFCIIDCPPSIGLLTFNALRAAAEVIIPVETGYFAMKGSIKQEATIEMLARRAGHRVRFSVLATMYDVRTRLAREILGELRRHYGDKLLPVVVHFNSKLKEAASFGQPITEYDNASRGMRDFEELSQWLMENPPPSIVSPLTLAAQPAQGCAQGATQGGAQTRAAELVQRARALSARTAALASKLTGDGQAVSVAVGGNGNGHENGHGRREELERVHAASESQQVTSATAVSSGNGNGNGAEGTKKPGGEARTIVTVDQNALRSIANGRQTATISPAAPEGTEPSSRSEAGRAGEGRLDAEQTRARLGKLFGACSTKQGVLFVQPDEEAKQVAVAGDFNGWEPTPLQRDQRLGVWQRCIDIAPGRYRYRLVVDGRWTEDPYNRYVESNPYGELNNVVEIEVE